MTAGQEGESHGKDLVIKNGNVVKGGLAMRKSGGDPNIIAVL